MLCYGIKPYGILSTHLFFDHSTSYGITTSHGMALTYNITSNRMILTHAQHHMTSTSYGILSTLTRHDRL